MILCLSATAAWSWKRFGVQLVGTTMTPWLRRAEGQRKMRVQNPVQTFYNIPNLGLVTINDLGIPKWHATRQIIYFLNVYPPPHDTI